MSGDPRTPESDDGEASEKGGGSYCGACHRSVAREDRVERAGEVYHRGCAPDDVVNHRTLDGLPTDGMKQPEDSA